MKGDLEYYRSCKNSSNFNFGRVVSNKLETNVKFMISKGKEKNLSPEEVKILKGNYKRMLQAPDFPEESKEAVKQSLKKLPHEKQ